MVEAQSDPEESAGYLRIENGPSPVLYIQKVEVGYYPDNHRPQTAQEMNDNINYAINTWCDKLMDINQGRINLFDLIDEPLDTKSEMENGMYDLKHSTEKIFWQDVLGSENYAPVVSRVAADAFGRHEGNPSELRFFISETGLENQKTFESLKYWIGIWDANGAKIDGINAKLNLVYSENAEKQAATVASLDNLLANLASTGKLIRLSNFDIKYQDAEGTAVTADKITADQRQKLADYLQKLMDVTESTEIREAGNEWLSQYGDKDGSRSAGEKLKAVLEAYVPGTEEEKAAVALVKENYDHLAKKSVWFFGGDGWAYDIGYGGLDHVLASGADVNVLVFDTEVYSNTGGQASKATPTGAVAQFAAAGKRRKKKDLGMMAMSYGDVYVAQVALGANPNQFLKAVLEAEAYNGPSLIIAYAPCINHGLRCGMADVQGEIKRAVDVGYWQLYRNNPKLAEEGRNSFQLDSKKPEGSFHDYLMGETRYAALTRTFPDVAEKLFAQTEAEAMARYAKYEALANQK